MENHPQKIETFSSIARDLSGILWRRGNGRANNVINGTIPAMMAWCSLGQSPLLHQGHLQEFDRLAMQRRALPTSPQRSSCLLDEILDILILREFDKFEDCFDLFMLYRFGSR